MRIIFLSLFLILSSNISIAQNSKQEMTATELNQICAEAYKPLKNSFNSALSAKCKGYISGFLDSMIVLENVGKTKTFCLSGNLSNAQASVLIFLPI